MYIYIKNFRLKARSRPEILITNQIASNEVIVKMNFYPKYYQTLVDVVHEIVIYNGKLINSKELVKMTYRKILVSFN